MSVIDYTKDLILFDSYDMQVIKMLISQLKLEQHELFNFLNEICIDDVQFFWYKDKNDSVLGGYYYLSYDFKIRKSAIYINKTFVDENSSYMQKMYHIILAFPTIMHELCHYWQAKKHPVLYFILQFPLIRQFTIENQAYMISEYIYQNSGYLVSMSTESLVKLKQKYGFSKMFYDELQKKFLNDNYVE